MAIQKCLYCGDNISELAVKCPKCQQTSPCDELIKNQRDKNNKRQDDRRDYAEKEHAILAGEVNCAECKKPIKISRVLAGQSCGECGFPSNKIPCQICGENADRYDARNKQYTCLAHLAEECKICGNLVSGNDKMTKWTRAARHGGSSSAYICCRSCHDKESRPSSNKSSSCLTVLCIFIPTILFIIRVMI